MSDLPTKTVEIAPGVSVTVRRATAHQHVYIRALGERFGAAFASDAVGETVAAYWRFFILCAAQTVRVVGVSFTPPGMFADLDAARASFEAWLDVLPKPDAVTPWLQAIVEVNAPDVPEALTPDGGGNSEDPKD